jgi:hypothetical protein
MKRIIILSLLLCITAKAYAQTEERIYFYNNGKHVSGVILEIVPDSAVTIKTESGAIISYQMKYVRRIVKLQHEILNKEEPNQMEHRTFSITGGLYFARHKEYGHIVINPSFNYFYMKDNSLGLILEMEEYSNAISLNGLNIKVGGVYQHFIGEEHSRPFIGLELFMNNEVYEVFEAAFCAGYNIPLSRNLAFQPEIKYSFYDFEDHALKYQRISIGFKIANYIF